MSPFRLRPKGALKAAVIGAGAFGRHHASKYRHIDGVELVAIADPSAEVRKTSLATHGVPAVADWRELLGGVDLVSVCTPAQTHAQIVRAFLNAGAHVLVEKPIATSVEEADALIALAADTNLVLTVGHQERFVFAGTGLLDHKEVPLDISCWRMGPWTGRSADVSVVLDLMIHDLDLVHQLVPRGCSTSKPAPGAARPPRRRSAASSTFANGTRRASGNQPHLRRAAAAACAPNIGDGVIEIDFVSRTSIRFHRTAAEGWNPKRPLERIGGRLRRLGAERRSLTGVEARLRATALASRRCHRRSHADARARRELLRARRRALKLPQFGR